LPDLENLVLPEVNLAPGAVEHLTSNLKLLDINYFDEPLDVKKLPKDLEILKLNELLDEHCVLPFGSLPPKMKRLTVQQKCTMGQGVMREIPPIPEVIIVIAGKNLTQNFEVTPMVTKLILQDVSRREVTMVSVLLSREHPRLVQVEISFNEDVYLDCISMPSTVTTVRIVGGTSSGHLMRTSKSFLH
jgi:hypothetical protein